MIKKLGVAFLLSLSCLLSATEPVSTFIQTQTSRPELGITEITLKNGMRICLKPIQFDEDEVLIRMTARGGYASLPSSQRAAGELAALVAWESGLEGMSTDKLAAKIYQHSIEVYAKVLPYHRVIEGTTDLEGIEFFFDLVQHYSLQKHFTREGFDRVVKTQKELLQEKDLGRGSSCEDWSRSIHTQNVPALKPLTLQDLNSMDFEKAKDFFEDYFSNPAEFVCVVVGNFKVEEVIPLVSRYLGAIPEKESTRNLSANLPQFPAGVTTRSIPAPGKKESLACLTYPLAPIKSPQQLRFAKLMAQVVEARLRTVVGPRTQCLSSMLELPFYPGLYLTWLSIQLRAIPDNLEGVKKMAMNEIQKMVAEGPTAAELTNAWKLLQAKEDLWQKDNQYWLSMLSDYFLRGWNWQELQKSSELESLPQFNEGMRTLLNPAQFSFIYTTPN